MRITHLRFLAALAALVAVLTVAGCSSSDESADATTTTAPSTCEAVQGLSDSITTLVSSDTLGGGTEAIDAALADVETAAQEVGDVAGDQFSSDVDALTEAIDNLASTLGELGSDASLGDTISALGTDANDVVEAFSTLATDVGDSLSDCELTTPSTVGS